MQIRDLLLPEFDGEMQNTHKILELVPKNRFDYKPDSDSMTLGRLAAHIAEIPSWGEPLFDREVLDLHPGEKPFEVHSTTELLDQFEKNVITARAGIAKASNEDFQKMWTVKFGGQQILSMPRHLVIRIAVLHNLIHHRAQLGVYLRLNKIPLPDMYGAAPGHMYIVSVNTSEPRKKSG